MIVEAPREDIGARESHDGEPRTVCSAANRLLNGFEPGGSVRCPNMFHDGWHAVDVGFHVFIAVFLGERHCAVGEARLDVLGNALEEPLSSLHKARDRGRESEGAVWHA